MVFFPSVSGKFKPRPFLLSSRLCRHLFPIFSLIYFPAGSCSVGDVPFSLGHESLGPLRKSVHFDTRPRRTEKEYPVGRKGIYFAANYMSDHLNWGKWGNGKMAEASLGW